MIDQFDVPAITRLFDETAFVGMSSYPSLSPHFKPDQLENALWQFAREIKYFGVNLEKVPCGWGPGEPGYRRRAWAAVCVQGLNSWCGRMHSPGKSARSPISTTQTT